MSDQWPTVDEVRARASQNVTEICANPKEYFRMQPLLRDRAGMLHHYDEQAKEIERLTRNLAEVSAAYTELKLRAGMETCACTPGDAFECERRPAGCGCTCNCHEQH